MKFSQVNWLQSLICTKKPINRTAVKLQFSKGRDQAPRLTLLFRQTCFLHTHCYVLRWIWWLSLQCYKGDLIFFCLNKPPLYSRGNSYLQMSESLTSNSVHEHDMDKSFQNWIENKLLEVNSLFMSVLNSFENVVIFRKKNCIDWLWSEK